MEVDHFNEFDIDLIDSQVNDNLEPDILSVT
jgi:hypothetical protein